MVVLDFDLAANRRGEPFAGKTQRQTMTFPAEYLPHNQDSPKS